MLRITGDTHGDLSRIKFAEEYEKKALGEGDTLIICGDFGFVFDGGKIENQKLDLLAQKPYTICFIDGNHENFDMLNTYPEIEFHGGRAHRIRDNVYHLMRGEIYGLEGKSIFTMGGAYSADRYMREVHESYWEEEMPTGEEYIAAYSNLQRHSMSVDIILTHTAPTNAILSLGDTPHPHEAELTDFLDKLDNEVKYGRWYFGHLHTDKSVSDKFSSLYFRCVDL